MAQIKKESALAKQTFNMIPDDTEAVIVSIDELSKTHAQTIERLTEDIKNGREMINDALAGDPSYHEISEKVKTLNKERMRIRTGILSLPGNAQIVDKVKKLTQERKEKQLALSDYLLELERMTGATQLELFDGTVYEIQKVATLRKRPKIRR